MSKPKNDEQCILPNCILNIQPMIHGKRADQVKEMHKLQK